MIQLQTRNTKIQLAGAVIASASVDLSNTALRDQADPAERLQPRLLSPQTRIGRPLLVLSCPEHIDARMAMIAVIDANNRAERRDGNLNEVRLGLLQNSGIENPRSEGGRL